MPRIATLATREAVGRAIPEWIGATPNTPVPPRVKARVFLAYDGVCYLSGRKIRPGEPWECEHIIALINGGQNREGNLAPALAEPHKAKTADDMAIKSKTARIRAKHLGIWPKGPKINSRKFSKRRPISVDSGRE